jgi:hypothetical protein
MSGRGFALSPTPPFFGNERPVRMKGLRSVLTCDDKRWWKFPHLARYACWLERLVGEALPEEEVGLGYLEFRHEPAGHEDEDVDRLHADGSYIRSVFTVFGPPTVYREGRVQRTVPGGHTLLMTAMDRAKAVGVRCTLHRRPGTGPERAVIVCSFEPRPEPPPLPRVYKDVGKDYRRCRKSRGGRFASGLRN